MCMYKIYKYANLVYEIYKTCTFIWLIYIHNFVQVDFVKNVLKPYMEGHLERQVATHWTVFPLVWGAMAPCLTDKAFTRPARWPCSSDAPGRFAEGSPRSPWLIGPPWLSKVVTQTLLLLYLFPAWWIQGRMGVIQVAGGIVFVCMSVYRKQSWDPHIGAKGWLRPIRSERSQGKDSPSPDLPSLQAGRGCRASASVPCRRIEGGIRPALVKRLWTVGSQWNLESSGWTSEYLCLCARQINLGPRELD